jgi:uncharacterized membrane protein
MVSVGMADFLVEIMRSVPSEVATVILATLPVGELRGALPVAILVYKMPVWPAVILSVLGNMLPVYFLLLFNERVADWLSERSSLARSFFDWLFERTRRKLHAKVEKYGYWALALFVAVPLPVTGAWTGTLAAFVFGMPRKKAFIAIFVGVCVSAAIVTGITMGTFSVVKTLFF